MVNRINFLFYDKSDFEAFLNTLPVKDAKKLVQLLLFIEEAGLVVAIKMKWVKKLDENLYEVRSKFGNNIQRAIYFHLEDTNYVITHGFTKKSQKPPQREKQRGITIRKSYLKHGGKKK